MGKPTNFDSPDLFWKFLSKLDMSKDVMVSPRQPKINIPVAKPTTLPSHQQRTMNNHSPQENSNDGFHQKMRQAMLMLTYQ